MEVVQKQEMGLIFFWRKVHGNAVSSLVPQFVVNWEDYIVFSSVVICAYQNCRLHEYSDRTNGYPSHSFTSGIKH